MASPEFDVHPFLLSYQDVAKRLETDVEQGLTEAQVQQRRAIYGLNELEVHEPTPWYSILFKQFCNAMIIVLFIILIVSFAIGDVVEGSVVGVVIVINVSIGFYQESGAEKKMDALRSLSSPSATVIRGGVSHIIPNAEVVPGDIVILRTGDTVPADVRLFESVNLNCDEQTMTGESLPVEKVTHNYILDPTTDERATVATNVMDGDRINLAFASTAVNKGRGRGIVIATGMATAVGKIAAASGKKKHKPGRSMSARKYGIKQTFIGGMRRTGDLILKLLGLSDSTPLQRRLTYMSYSLFLCAVAITIIVFGVHKFKLTNEVVLYATSTGIAIIPESLAIVLIMTMVQATRVMRKSNVVVRDLSALEQLGGVTNICSDKTGTLTQGAMIVKKAWLPMSRVLTLKGSTEPHDPTTGKVLVADHNIDDDDQGEVSAAPTPGGIAFADDKQPGVQNNEPEEHEAELTPELRMFLFSCALCNVATVRQDPETNEWQAIGEPTEIALQVFAKRFNMGKKVIETSGWVQKAEFPFDSTIKRMSVIYDAPEDDGGVSGLPAHNNHNSVVFSKGAVERIIERCSMVRTGTDETGATCEPMTDVLKDRIIDQMNTFAPLGLRVLAIAYREWDGKFVNPLENQRRPSVSAGPSSGLPPAPLEAKADHGEDIDTNGEEKAAHNMSVALGKSSAKARAEAEKKLRAGVEDNLTFLGLVGIYDPPRTETAPAIRECVEAGIRVHMLTGDHPATARAIANEVGILPANPAALPADVADALVMPAPAFDALSDAQLDALPLLPLVVARCTPETKTRMIEALRRRGKFIAMTGDGVNDAPSLSRADVGIAMGSGSDVAKSAAAIVLTDDKFSSIVAAVREGRRMFDNIQKFMLHLLVSNVAEVILLIIGLSFRDRDGYSVFPVSALHILWINIFTSALPALGLGQERAALDIMNRPPHGRGIFTRQLVADMMVYGIVMGAITLLTFVTVVYGVHGGELGSECNHAISPECRPVFKARAVIFVQLVWLILFSAWEFKDMRRSMLRLTPHSPHNFPMNVAYDLYENKLLFYSVILGLVPSAVLVYIPVLNEKVFRHTIMTWQWSLVVAGLVLFILAVEAWKYSKRAFGLFQETADMSEGYILQGTISGRQQMGDGVHTVRVRRILSKISLSSRWTEDAV